MHILWVIIFKDIGYKYYFGVQMGINFVENNKKLTDNEVILLINNGEYENLQIIIDRYLPKIITTATTAKKIKNFSLA